MVSNGIEHAVGKGSVSALFSQGSPERRRLEGWMSDTGSWAAPSWAIACIGAGAAVGLAFPHWRMRWWLPGAPAALLLIHAVAFAAVVLGQWAGEDVSLAQACRVQAREFGSFTLFIAPLAAGLVLASVAMRATLGVSRAAHLGRGLGSRRLRRARKIWRER